VKCYVWQYFSEAPKHRATPASKIRSVLSALKKPTLHFQVATYSKTAFPQVTPDMETHEDISGSHFQKWSAHSSVPVKMYFSPSKWFWD